MKINRHAQIVCAALLLTGVSLALVRSGGRKGPFNPEALPPTINPAQKVHFVSIDNAFEAPNSNWTPNLKILTGGDHTTEAVTVGGHTGVQVMGVKFNTADDLYPLWANEHTVDILMQFYGDATLLNADGTSRYFNFLTGTLPEPIAMDGGELPPHAKNGRWNWVLFRVPNGLRHMDGGRLIGTLHPRAKKELSIAEVSKNSGQNGGTIRMDGLHDFKVRFVAFGQRGAFGEPEQINHFKR